LDPLLAQMAEDVAALVLRDNYLQGEALSVAQARGPAALDRQIRLIRDLERAGRLDRAIEFLPDDDTLAARAAARQGLTRPELAGVGRGYRGVRGAVGLAGGWAEIEALDNKVAGRLQSERLADRAGVRDLGGGWLLRGVRLDMGREGVLFAACVQLLVASVVE